MYLLGFVEQNFARPTKKIKLFQLFTMRIKCERKIIMEIENMYDSSWNESGWDLGPNLHG